MENNIENAKNFVRGKLAEFEESYVNDPDSIWFSDAIEIMVSYASQVKPEIGYSEEDIMTFYKHVKTHTYQEAIDHMKKLKSK